MLQDSGGVDVPYLGYVETCLRIPEVKAFDTDILLFIVPDSAYTMHILATKKELENLNKQWKRSLIATKLTMKEAQLMNQEDAQIVSQVDSIVKTTRDIIITPFGTTKVKDVVKVPNHYKGSNVVIDDLP